MWFLLIVCTRFFNNKGSLPNVYIYPKFKDCSSSRSLHFTSSFCFCTIIFRMMICIEIIMYRWFHKSVTKLDYLAFVLGLMSFKWPCHQLIFSDFFSNFPIKQWYPFFMVKVLKIYQSELNWALMEIFSIDFLNSKYATLDAWSIWDCVLSTIAYYYTSMMKIGRDLTSYGDLWTLFKSL